MVLIVFILFWLYQVQHIRFLSGYSYVLSPKRLGESPKPRGEETKRLGDSPKLLGESPKPLGDSERSKGTSPTPLSVPPNTPFNLLNA
ncbi:hypothetical protein Barb6_00633 [Bacteroidales bacterium Barb6]|nr:hypothetical protein Barb6_00633 [Bacteroidales bacterium Barb6]